MKRTLLTGILLFVFAAGIMAAENPIDKGSIMLGGSLYFQSQGGDLYKEGGDDGQTTIGISPNVGYFIAPSIMIGAMVDWTKWSQGDYKISEMSLGPTVGYFFNMNSAEVKGSIYPYVAGFFMYSSFKDEDGENEDKATATSFGGKGGIMYMLSEAVALDINLMYRSDSYKPDGADESVSGSTIKVGAGIQAFIF